MTHVFRSPYPRPEIPDVSLPALILSRADQISSKTALIDPVGRRSWTFGELAGDVRRVAAGLTGMGFRKNDVLALVGPNSAEWAIVFLASSLAGGVATLLNPASTANDIRTQAGDSGARYVFTTPELVDRVALANSWRAVLTPESLPGTIGLDTLSGPPERFPAIDPDRDTAVLPYSSGTTGISRGVRLTHRNIVANLHQIARPIFTGEDVIVGLAPFFHIYGLTVVLLLGLLLGATDVVLPRFELLTFADTIRDHDVTHANLVPPLILALARHPDIDSAALETLRTVQSGAAPLPAETALQFSSRFGCRVLQGYGLTETSPVTHVASRDRFDIPIESVGPPVAGTECSIRDLTTGEPLGPGERGELYVRGPQVMAGYLDAPDKTRETLDADGWLRTGDVAWADEAGNFYIVDRVKELIKYKAYPIAPAELEAVLLTHPAVGDAAVIPDPDPTVGEVPKAYVVRRRPLGQAELIQWFAGQVAPHKKIRRVEFVDEIPKSVSGKILRRVLIERDRSRRAL
jgi:acyl-CoA synthetase (AMP-forming)/AMP-acid ligase II